MTGTSRDDECESCFAAARNGHAQCLKFLHETNSPWDAITCNAAATHGNFECLRYAHENGCPWDKWTCTEAAENGHLECLKYARENGCPWDKMGSHGNEVWPHRLRRLGDQKWLP